MCVTDAGIIQVTLNLNASCLCLFNRRVDFDATALFADNVISSIFANLSRYETFGT